MTGRGRGRVGRAIPRVAGVVPGRGGEPGKQTAFSLEVQRRGYAKDKDGAGRMVFPGSR